MFRDAQRIAGVCVFEFHHRAEISLELATLWLSFVVQERKRLAALLEHLRGHGVVSDVDAQERITIRPMIAHLANPENLQALLTQLRALSADSTGNAT